MLVSMSFLSRATGANMHTVRAAIERLPKVDGRGNAVLVESSVALPLVLKAMAGQLNLEQEKAKLAKAQCERVSLDVKRLQRELVDTEDVREAWEQGKARFGAELAPLPAEIADAAISAGSIKEIETSVREIVYRTLRKLGGTEP